jgi:hypothetical protein
MLRLCCADFAEDITAFDPNAFVNHGALKKMFDLDAFSRR